MDITKDEIIIKNIKNLDHLFTIVKQRYFLIHNRYPTSKETMKIINEMRESKNLDKLYLDPNLPENLDELGELADIYIYDQNKLTTERLPELKHEFVNENMNDIRLQYWVNSNIADDIQPYYILQEINKIREQKGFKKVYWTKHGYNLLDHGDPNDPNWNYTNDKKKRHIGDDEKEIKGLQKTRHAFKMFQESLPADKEWLNILSPDLWGDSSRVFLDYLTPTKKRPRSRSRSRSKSKSSSHNSSSIESRGGKRKTKRNKHRR